MPNLHWVYLMKCLMRDYFYPSHNGITFRKIVRAFKRKAVLKRSLQSVQWLLRVFSSSLRCHCRFLLQGGFLSAFLENYHPGEAVQASGSKERAGEGHKEDGESAPLPCTQTRSKGDVSFPSVLLRCPRTSGATRRTALTWTSPMWQVEAPSSDRSLVEITIFIFLSRSGHRHVFPFIWEAVVLQEPNQGMCNYCHFDCPKKF